MTTRADLHHCHWPGCRRLVQPRMWGCPQHWYTLPLDIRNAIWKSYRSGQEVDKRPSTEYLSAANRARDWIVAHEKVLRENNS